MIDPARLRAQIEKLPTFYIELWKDWITRADQPAVLLGDVLKLLDASTDESPKQYYWRDKNVDELTHEEAIAALKRTIDRINKEREWQADRDFTKTLRVLSQR